MCMFAIGIMKSLTFHCTRPGGRTPAPNSPRSRIWPVDRMMRLQTVAVSSAALPRDHWTPDTLCDRNSCHGYSIHCPNNRMFHLKWRILDCHSNWLTISISQNEYLCFWHVKWDVMGQRKFQALVFSRIIRHDIPVSKDEGRSPLRGCDVLSV